MDSTQCVCLIVCQHTVQFVCVLREGFEKGGGGGVGVNLWVGYLVGDGPFPFLHSIPGRDLIFGL